MAISKRLRYEILRRDNNRCRYCGAQAGETELTIDHVKPTVLGGTDDPANLVAACRDCNSGKSSSSPDATLVAQVSQDAIRWAAAMRMAAEQAEKERGDARDRLDPWLDNWNAQDPWGLPRYTLPRDWAPTVLRFLDAGLSMEALLSAANLALGARGVQACFPYFVGVANNKLRDLEERAESLLTGPTEKPTSYAEYAHGALSAVVDRPPVSSSPGVA